MVKTKIKEAAILSIRDGLVYTGRRHCDVIREMVEVYGIKPPVDNQNYEQGFVTNKKEFVTRVEAAEIAIASGQIKELKWPPLLYSEDLY